MVRRMQAGIPTRRASKKPPTIFMVAFKRVRTSTNSIPLLNTRQVESSRQQQIKTTQRTTSRDRSQPTGRVISRLISLAQSTGRRKQGMNGAKQLKIASSHINRLTPSQRVIRQTHNQVSMATIKKDSVNMKSLGDGSKSATNISSSRRSSIIRPIKTPTGTTSAVSVTQ
jgi:hypothetical protein